MKHDSLDVELEPGLDGADTADSDEPDDDGRLHVRACIRAAGASSSVPHGPIRGTASFIC